VIHDEDRQDLAALILRALDLIEERYEDDDTAELTMAALVFEVRTGGDEEAEPMFVGERVLLPSTSPHHASGVLSAIAGDLLNAGQVGEGGADEDE
jgi:hypothetical protein